MDPRMSFDDPTDAERYPILTEAGREMLRFLREHPHAPLFRNESGHRLTESDVAQVRAFEAEVLGASVPCSAVPPSWVADGIARCYERVSHYSALGSAPRALVDVPPVTRADLARDIAAFVPDDVPTERLINFRTTGTTGHPLLVASHPVVAASYLALHKRALRRFGVELHARRGQVGVLLLGFQKKCFTYVSVTPTMDESGLAKINLHPDDWRHPDDRSRYVDALGAEVIAGDPISFAELLRLPLATRPRALLCTAMALGEGLRALLESRFGCPVLDLYSMNEAGPIAVFDPALGGHVLLQHRLFVEILDDAGQPVAPGERGEVTLTGGFNFCLPLLRYRTGDHASLDCVGGEPVLRGFEGRLPVRFRTTHGELVNNIDVTHALAPLAVARFSLHQNADASLRLTLSGFFGSVDEARRRVLSLFGHDQVLEVALESAAGDKVVQYSSDLPDAAP
jgi:phenylacetate-CoA ligase